MAHDFCDMPSTVYHEERRVSRKQRTCGETGKVIEIGEAYYHCSGLCEGSWWKMAQSEAAYHFARGFNHVLHRGGCVEFGGIEEAIGDCADWCAEREKLGVTAEELREEWKKVRSGIVTRDTTDIEACRRAFLKELEERAAKR